MLTLEQAKNLQPGDQVVVTRTQEVWTVRVNAPVNHPKSVRVLINNGRVDSFFDENRLNAFDLFETPALQPNLPSAEAMAAGLRPGMEAAYREVKEQEEIPEADIEERVESTAEEYGTVTDETGIEQRIEKKFIEEPKLTKPARKPATKKKSK